MKVRFVQISLALCALVVSLPISAAQRTIVASNGNDANPCSITLPCRAFSAAIALTSLGGEVVVLDSAGYGPVAIAQSVSITAPAGVYAGVSVSSGDGITINGAGAEVKLTGLRITGLGGQNGIVFTQGASLEVSDCVISGMAAAGISVTATGASVTIRDVSIAKSGGDGIEVTGDQKVLLDRVNIARGTLNGVHGVGSMLMNVRGSTVVGNTLAGIRMELGAMFQPMRFHVEDTTISGNTGIAIDAFVGTGTQLIFSITKSVLTSNGGGGMQSNEAGGSTVFGVVADSTISDNGSYGIATGNHSTVVATGNRVHRNGTGFLQVAPSTFVTNSNNSLRDNATATTGVITPQALQ